MSIYEHQFRFEIQNQKVDRIWKTEYQAADRPPVDRGPSAVSGTGQSGQQCRKSECIRTWTVRRPCADRPRQAVKPGRGSRLVISAHCISSLALHSLKRSPSLIVRGQRREVTHGQSDSLWKSSTNMSSSRYFVILWISSNLFNFGIIRVSSLI
jgi:hypothetical protein